MLVGGEGVCALGWDWIEIAETGRDGTWFSGVWCECG